MVFRFTTTLAARSMDILPSRKYQVGLYLLGLLIAGAASAADVSSPILRSGTRQFTFVRPVNAAPDTPLHGIDGSITSLSQFRGRVVILNFWATWCRPCAEEMPSLERLAAIRQADEVAVVAVSIDESADAVRPFLSATGIRHVQVYLDPDQRLGSLYDNRVTKGALTLYGLPASYVIDKSGNVIGYIVGAVKWDTPEANRFLDYFSGSAHQSERPTP